MEEPKDRERLALTLPEDGAPQLLLQRSWEFPGASSKAWLLGLSLTLWVLHSLPNRFQPESVSVSYNPNNLSTSRQSVRVVYVCGKGRGLV